MAVAIRRLDSSNTNVGVSKLAAGNIDHWIGARGQDWPSRVGGRRRVLVRICHAEF